MSDHAQPTVIAKRFRSKLVEGFPSAVDWEGAEPIGFDRDWQGQNPDLGRSTGVRLLWTPDEVYIRFVCRYRNLSTFASADSPGGRKDQLWDRDVAEAFLQPDRFGQMFYREFEVSPNGFWIDLEITPDPRPINLNSGLRRKVQLDTTEQVWTAQLAIPVRSITRDFEPRREWRANFFRCEGRDPKRAYLAWQPTHTEQPNFHVPGRFGSLRFEE